LPVTNLPVAVIVGCSMADCLPDPRAAACNGAKLPRLNAQILFAPVSFAARTMDFWRSISPIVRFCNPA